MHDSIGIFKEATRHYYDIIVISMYLASSKCLSRILSRTLSSIPSKFLLSHFNILNTQMKKLKSTKFVCLLRNLKSPWKDYMIFYKNYGKLNLYIIVLQILLSKSYLLKYFYRDFLYIIWFNFSIRNFRNIVNIF